MNNPPIRRTDQDGIARVTLSQPQALNAPLPATDRRIQAFLDRRLPPRG
jgi:enoyl-CoA hydratase/carnithine racemase